MTLVTLLRVADGLNVAPSSLFERVVTAKRRKGRGLE